MQLPWTRIARTACFMGIFGAALLTPGVASSQTIEELDEPGLGTPPDEPALVASILAPQISASNSAPAFRLELAFGYVSLLEDPDVQGGRGGGIFFAYGLHRRIGAELSIFLSQNDYEDLLGSIGGTFLAGNVSLGPIFQLTPPGNRLGVTVDLGLGAYLVVPVIQESVWSLGASGGLTLSYRLASFIGVGVKCRYHLFNLATIAGPELKDLKAFMKVGVIDRLEIPGYLAFYF